LIKVAFVSTFPPQVCGIGKYCEDVVNSLHDKAEIKVFNEGTYWKRGTPLGSLAHDILTWKPDIIHIQHAYGFFFQIPEFSAFLKLLRDKPVVITMHEIPTHEHQLWYNDSNATFIFPNKAGFDYAQKHFGFNAKYEIIPHGATLFEAIPKDLARKELNLPQDRIILVQPGFWGYGKGIKELIEAASLLKDEYNLIIAFAGGMHPLAIDEDKRFFKKALTTASSLNLKNNLIFTGRYLSEGELNKWISAADIIVLNHQFVYPAVSASAIGKRVIDSGKPCIFGDDPRLSEFEDGKVCLKVKSNDPTDIAEKIRRLISNPDLQNTLGDNAKEFANNISWAEVSKRHLDLYERTVNGKL